MIATKENERYLEQAELNKWIQSLYYRQIRGSESLLPGLKENGKRIRGLTLGPNFYLARDKNFYQVVDGVATRLDPLSVLNLYDLATLKTLYLNAIQHPVGV